MSEESVNRTVDLEVGRLFNFLLLRRFGFWFNFTYETEKQAYSLDCRECRTDGYLSFERRRPDKFHFVFAKKCSILHRWIRYGGSAEELLHLTRRSESDQHSPRNFADRSKRVRNVAGRKNGLSGAEMFAVVSDLKKDLAPYHVEPLLLMGVQVKRWTTFHQVGVFNDEQAPACFAGRDLEEYLAVPARMRLAIAILARTYYMSGFRRSGD